MENGSRNTRRRGRKESRQTEAAADAFRQLESSVNRPSFGFLSDTDIEEMMERAFNLLSDYGVMIIHPKAIEALQANGAIQGSDAGRFRLPRQLVEEARGREAS